MVVAPDLRDGKPPVEQKPWLENNLRLRLFGWPAVPEVRRHYHPDTCKAIASENDLLRCQSWAGMGS